MPEPIPEQLRSLGESAGQAWSEIAPLLHPEVAQYLYTLTGQVLWLCKEVERLKALLNDGEADA
jgi:hypothetical protein